MTITTFRKEFQSANCLVATAGSNCPQGGDAGHGGRTFISFEDLGGTVFNVTVTDELGEEETTVQAGKVSLVFCGDSENETAIQALEFMLGVLKGDAVTQTSADAKKNENVD
jgi:hypothetical protein